MTPLQGLWHSMQVVESLRYECGHCSTIVASDKGWYAILPSGVKTANVRICPNCNKASYLGEIQAPGIVFGNPVGSLPAHVGKLYDECRACTAANAFPAVLAARKLLMHIAVDKGAAPNETFITYIEHLAKAVMSRPTARDGSITYAKRGMKRIMKFG